MQQGSLEALGELYDRHRQVVYRTALAITGDGDAANDLLQDVFLRLFRFAERIDCHRPLEPWLYRMTINLAYTWIKRDRRWYRPLENLVEWIVGSDENHPLSIIEQKDDWQQVQRAVSALPIPQRIVIVLYYLNDLSLQEISEILNIPVGTVKSRLHYGRHMLKKSLGLLREVVPDLTYGRT
jgi:RNA polymerase sigma-70 factor (ECF subfamily)